MKFRRPGPGHGRATRRRRRRLGEGARGRDVAAVVGAARRTRAGDARAVVSDEQGRDPETVPGNGTVDRAVQVGRSRAARILMAGLQGRRTAEGVPDVGHPVAVRVAGQHLRPPESAGRVGGPRGRADRPEPAPGPPLATSRSLTFAVTTPALPRDEHPKAGVRNAWTDREGAVQVPLPRTAERRTTTPGHTKAHVRGCLRGHFGWRARRDSNPQPSDP